jgi:hypothetical protein
MKTVSAAVFALSLMLGSAFAAAKQDAPKVTDTKSTVKSTTHKVKKSKKNVKSTSAAVKPVAKPVAKSVAVASK